jgi:hypothetical protein
MLRGEAFRPGAELQSDSVPEFASMTHGARTMSKLYAGFLVIASLFAMAALGMLILMLITEVSHLVAPSYSPAMGR